MRICCKIRHCPIFGKIRHPSNFRQNSSSSLSKSTIKYHTPRIVPSFTTPQLLNIVYIFLLFLRANLPQKGCSRRAHEKVADIQYYSYAIQVDRCLLLIFFLGATGPSRTRTLWCCLRLGVEAYRTSTYLNFLRGIPAPIVALGGMIKVFLFYPLPYLTLQKIQLSCAQKLYIPQNFCLC